MTNAKRIQLNMIKYAEKFFFSPYYFGLIIASVVLQQFVRSNALALGTDFIVLLFSLTLAYSAHRKHQTGWQIVGIAFVIITLVTMYGRILSLC